MRTLLCQLYGQTLQSLRGERSRAQVAERGEISPSTDGSCDLHNQTMTLTTISERPAVG